jgi:hypothetical protein
VVRDGKRQGTSVGDDRGRKGRRLQDRGRPALYHPVQQVSLTTVSFGDRTNYKVKLTRTSDGSVFAFARTPLGIGSAALTKQ